MLASELVRLLTQVIGEDGDLEVYIDVGGTLERVAEVIVYDDPEIAPREPVLVLRS